MMTNVYVSIGSNIEREKHICAALDALAGRFGELALSSVYESEAVGFEGDPFYNLVAAFQTSLPLATLALELRDIEHQHGRQRGEARFAARTLDIDILTYGDACGVIEGIELPRAEILLNAFVLLPLAELAPKALHPATGQTYGELWSQYQSPQKLWPVPFRWQERLISQARPA